MHDSVAVCGWLDLEMFYTADSCTDTSCVGKMSLDNIFQERTSLNAHIVGMQANAVPVQM